MAGIATVLAAIDSEGPLPYAEDGQTFQNREGLLPAHPIGYYREYTVETPGSPDRGARRLVIGEEGETYYTADHYASFTQHRSGRLPAVRTVVFTDEAPELDGFEVLTLEGGSIESKEELLDAIAEGFGFPDWFGRNWDALEECLRDLDAVNDGYALVITDATALWAERPRVSGTLVEVWLDAAADGAERGVELRLVFEW